MTRALIAVGMALALGTAGAALDTVSPVLFASEPVVLRTAGGVGSPVLAHGGEVWEVTWRSAPDGGRVRWEADLGAGAPLGVWIASVGSASYAFLRAPDDLGLAAVRASPGTELAIAGEMRVADGKGWAFFLLPPGDHELVAQVGKEEVRRSLRIEPGTRTNIALILASLETSTAVVLPSYSLTLFLHLIAPADLPALNAEVELPEGWSYAPDPGVFDPVFRDRLTVRSWRISVPEAASPGDYELAIALPDFGLEARALVAVVHRLPFDVVVGHWDVTAEQLDLTLPCELTYDRLLWAATFVGRELPFTGRVFSPADLRELASRWGEP